MVDLPIRMGASDVALTPSSLPAGLGVQLFLLLITFSQEINGVLYPLKNEEFNVLQIIDVVAPWPQRGNEVYGFGFLFV